MVKHNISSRRRYFRGASILPGCFHHPWGIMLQIDSLSRSLCGHGTIGNEPWGLDVSHAMPLINILVCVTGYLGCKERNKKSESYINKVSNYCCEQHWCNTHTEHPVLFCRRVWSISNYDSTSSLIRKNELQLVLLLSYMSHSLWNMIYSLVLNRHTSRIHCCF